MKKKKKLELTDNRKQSKLACMLELDTCTIYAFRLYKPVFSSNVKTDREQIERGLKNRKRML